MIRHIRRFCGHSHGNQIDKPVDATVQPQLENLEPRVLFSAAPAEAPADSEAAPRAAEETVVVSVETAREAAATVESTETIQEGLIAHPTLSGQTAVPAEQTINLVNLNPGVEEVHRETLEAVAEAAADRWRATGLTADQSAALDRIEYVVEDLGGTHLGFAEGNRITLDDNAAGNLWFIDPTPLVDEEYAANSDTLLSAKSDTFAWGKTDLLTVILHEQGNLLGLEDAESGTGNVMLGVLGYNDRVLPAEGQAVGATPGTLEASFLDSGVTGGGDNLDVRQPFLGVNYAIITYDAIFPSPGDPSYDDPFLGEIKMFGGNFAPEGSLLAQGQLLAISQNSALFSLLGTTYGGDGESTFGLPDLRGRAPIGAGNGPGVDPVALGEKSGSVSLGVNQLPSHNHSGLENSGGGQAHSIEMPTLGLNYVISTQGVYGSTLGEIKLFAGNFATAGRFADGSLLPIAQNTALFSLLGTTYGGDGETTFALPDLRGRIAVNDGTGPGLSTHQVGARFGQNTNTLTTANLPGHHHTLPAGGNSGDTGAGQSFNIVQPTLAIDFRVNTDGVFPGGFGSEPNGTIGAIRMGGREGVFSYSPNVADAEGDLLPIAQNTALFSLFGTLYGGDGETTFGLPDLRGRAAVGSGNGPNLDPVLLGRKGGSETISLTEARMAAHSHEVANTAPASNNNAGLTVDEGSSGNTIGQAALEFTDGEQGAADVTYTLDTVPANGTLHISGGAALTAGATFTQSQINSNALTYDHDGNETTSDSIQFDVTDGAGGAANDVTFSFTITPRNDAPTVGTNAGLTVNEGGSGTITSSELNENDPDDSGTGLTYTVTALPGNGSVKLSGTALVLNGTFTQADIDANNVTYEHDGSETTSDSFNFSLADGGENGAGTATGTFNLTVTPQNDSPAVGTNAALTVLEGGSGTITTSKLNENDPDDSGTGLTYSVSALPSNGSVKLNGTALVLNGTFTQDDVDNSRVTYVHDGSETTSDSFDFSLADGGENGASAATGTFNLTITPQNDSPAIGTNTGLTILEGGSGTLTSSELNENDPDDSGTGLTFTVTALPGNGSVKLSGTALVLNGTFTQDDVDNSRVTYVHDGSETTSDSFDFSLADGGENGASAATGTFNLTITPQNDSPAIGTNAGLTVNEDGSGTLTSSELNENDPDDSGTGLTYTVTALPGNGSVKLSGTALVFNGTFTQADIGANNVTYEHDGSETTSDSFDFSLADGGENGASATTGTFNLTITPQNDPPTMDTNSGITVDEGSTGNLIRNTNLTSSDVEQDSTLIIYTLDAAPSNGTLKLSGTALAAGDTFTQFDVNGRRITYDHTAANADPDSFQFDVSDGAGGAVNDAVFNITVTPAPVVVGATVSFVGTEITVEDTLGVNNNILVQIVNGKIQLSDPAGITAGAGATQVDANTIEITVDPATLTAFTVLGGAGDDNLTIDVNGGVPVPFNGLHYDGGENAGDNDTLTILRGASPQLNATFTNPNDGALNFRNMFEFTYENLEPIIVTTVFTDVFLDFTGGAETIRIFDDIAGDGMITIDSTQGESLSLAVPTGSMTINAGTGDDIILIESLDAAWTASLIINGDGGQDTVVQSGAVIVTGSSFVTYDVEGIELTAGVALTTDTGDITLTGTGGTGNLTGVALRGAEISSTSGNVEITGQGGTTGNFNRGVLLDVGAGSASEIRTSGSITLDGTGGSGGLYGAGVTLIGSTVESMGAGPVTITGSGGAGTLFSEGVSIHKGSTIDAGTGDLMIMGTGGAAGTLNRGVSGGLSELRSAGGNITIDGTGGGTGIFGVGVDLTVTEVETTGTGTVTIRGTGASGSLGNMGVKLSNSSSVSAVDGAVQILGIGNGSSLLNHGIQLTAGTSIGASGNGGVTLTGTGGAGTTLNNGVDVSGPASLSVSDGDLTVNGSARGTASMNRGIHLIHGTLTASGSGNIALTGTGSQSASGVFNTGINMAGGGLRTVGGNVTLNGAGGDGSTYNEGVRIAGAVLRSTGGGTLSLTGTANGGTSGVYNSGGYLLGVTLDSGGTINVTGTGGGGTLFNHGIFMQSISAPGSAPATDGDNGAGNLSEDEKGDFF